MLSMGEVKASIQLLREWRTQASSQVTEALQRLSLLKTPPEDQLAPVADALAAFHKDIGRAKEEEIDTSWF